MSLELTLRCLDSILISYNVCINVLVVLKCIYGVMRHWLMYLCCTYQCIAVAVKSAGTISNLFRLKY